MKRLLAVIAAIGLSACDVREAFNGQTSDTPDTYQGGFFDLPTKKKNVEPTANPATPKDYTEPKQTQEIKTASTNDYVQFSSAADYVPPKPPKPVAQTEEEQDDVIMVPKRTVKPAVKTVKPAENIIVVKPKDTLYSLARTHNVPLRDLITANKLSAPYALAIGQKLYLPAQFVHTVAKGETLYSISRLYGMDLNSLSEMNNIKAPYALGIGQKLTLPAQIQTTNSAGLVAQSTAPATPKTIASAATAGGTKTTTPKTQPLPATATSAKTTGAPKQAVKTTPAPIKSLPKTAARSSSKFLRPVNGSVLSSFGAKTNGLYNDGINIKAARGATVMAAENGVVAYAGNEIKGLGNLIIIKHSDGWMTVYSHLDSIAVSRGKSVRVGSKIGTVGQTGKVNSPQLHFEIRKGTKAYDPSKYLK